MPTAPTPLPTIPPFPALADRATGTYNSKAYDWATGWKVAIAPAIKALADNAYDNAVEGAASAAAAAASAALSAQATGTAIGFTFDVTTTDADPGAGKLRLNNATQNAATVIRADNTSAAGSDVAALLATFGNGTSTVKGRLRIQKATDATKWLIFDVTAVASPSGYKNITASCTASSATNPFANGDALALSFQATGDKGDTGATGATGTFGGTATSTAEFLTGTAIASASTVNLNTATGNRVHVTGTTTITAWTLTRGPRTVIFDGALQLTYHATNNRLNSNGANVTVEAGDMAYIESDGTTVFVNVIKKSGAAVVGGGLVLVGSPVVASSSATVDITGISGSYGAYLLTGRGIRPSTDASSLLLQMTLGGSLVTSSTYKYHENASSSAATTYSAIRSASASSIQMGGFGMGNGSSKSLDFDMMIYAPGSTALEKLVCWRGVAAGYDGTLYASNGIGQNTGTGALTALRFTPTAGTVTEGTFALYALTNS